MRIIGRDGARDASAAPACVTSVSTPAVVGPSSNALEKRPRSGILSPSRWCRRCMRCCISAATRHQEQERAMLGVIEESPHRWRVGLVDDDPSALRATARLLTVDGYDVSAFSSASEFLESIELGIPDVLLVDLRMPDVNGLELQAALNERRLFLPMIFMSAYASVASSVQALRGG